MSRVSSIMIEKELQNKNTYFICVWLTYYFWKNTLESRTSFLHNDIKYQRGFTNAEANMVSRYPVYTILFETVRLLLNASEIM